MSQEGRNYQSTFHLSGKLNASSSEIFRTEKSLKTNQGLLMSLLPSASGTGRKKLKTC